MAIRRPDLQDTKVKIKICGITNLPDALLAQGLKADALGFVFYSASPRYIRPQAARKIILRLNKSIKKIGVFVNPKKDYATRVARLCGLDMLQFHGNESPEFCAEFKDYQVIKSFRIKGKESLKDINRYNSVDYYLFDTFKKGLAGGTGRTFDWGLLRSLKIPKPFFLSGGLNPENVNSAIRSVHPDFTSKGGVRPCWVDASSGLEQSPGKKDVRLLKKFIDKVRLINKG